MRLQLGAAALGLDAVAGIGIGCVLDEFERDLVAEGGIEREVDVGHAPAAELMEDLVLADLAAGRGDHGRIPRIA